MTSMFFYGTLCHLDLLELVIGRALRDDEVRAVRLPEHAVYWAKDQIFPMIRKEPGGFAEGIVFEADDEALARLNFYEGGFNFDLELIVPEGESDPVEVYFAQPGTWEFGDTWNLQDFIRDHGAHNLRTAAAFMRLYGRVSRDEAMKRLPMLRAMAKKGWVVGDFAPNEKRAGMTTDDVELIRHSRPYDNFFAMDEVQLRHKRFDGSISDEMERAALISVDAMLLLPYDPKRDRVLLVEQFRVGPFLRGDDNPWMLEPIAGRIDAGETAEDAAHREAMEEAEITLQELLPVSGHYPSPGTSCEYYHCFLGIADLPDGVEGVGGVADENEDIRSQLFSFDELMALLDSGEAQVGPLVTTALWLARHRDRLREKYSG
ncbi:NUDIX domain-containing protein [Halocynthiibacter sp.]|uniref:NUDIX domain-containing protein n=1 Tax=Halocynthiibacter sp. TaxID=1979210 RepID=UPI003C5F4B0A